MVTEAMRLKYAVTDVFVEAKDFGVPQHRKRYFFVAHRVKVDWSSPLVKKLPTVDEALDRASKVNDAVKKTPTSVAAVLGEMGQGENARMAYDRMTGYRRRQSSRPAFLYDRLAADRPSYTILGSCNKIHPHEDRMVSVNESASLCGYPRDYEFIGSTTDRYAQIGKGVCPPVASWLAENLRRAVDGGVKAIVKRVAVSVEMGSVKYGVG